MIKNIVFDMGNVLIWFTPEKYVERLGKNKEDSELLLREVFRAPEWAGMDRGELTEKEFLKVLEDRLPSYLQTAAYQLIMKWDDPVQPVYKMEELVWELKEKGYRILLLSNASVRQHAYWNHIPGSQYFEDTLISADVKMVKPNPEIYQELFRKFDIKPEESVFIDDSPANIQAGKNLGMDGFVFTGDMAVLRKWLQEKLSNSL